MSHLLSVCHSAGDSNVIIETAKQLAEEAIPTTVLVVGVAARNNIKKYLAPSNGDEKNALTDFVSMLDLDELLPTLKPIDNQHLSLNEEEISALTEKLNLSNFTGLLVGTPSYTNVEAQSEIPRQLLQIFGGQLNSALVSDYAFYDQNHHISQDKWFNLAKKFFVPFEKALWAFGLKTNENEQVSEAASLQSIVVGHPSIDATKALYHDWLMTDLKTKAPDQKRNEIREVLGLQAEQKFIFVAAGKAGDEAMVNALAHTCQQFPNIQIILGMHPAATMEYLLSIQSIINNNHVQKQIVFKPKSLSTDEVVYAADGVMTVSSTVGTTAAACRKLVAFYQESSDESHSAKPYIVDECEKAHFCTEEFQLIPFYEAVQSNVKVMSLDDLTLGETAAQKIAQEMKALMKP